MSNPKKEKSKRKSLSSSKSSKVSSSKILESKNVKAVKKNANRPAPKKDTGIESYESKRELLRKYLMNKDDKNQLTGDGKIENSKEKIGELKELSHFMMIERFLFLFGLLYFALSIFAFIFYSNKRALSLTGLPCSLHVFRITLIQLSKKMSKLNTSLVNIFINFIWLIFILSIIISFLLKDNEQQSKIEFSNEIILHVGLAIYTPIVILSSYNSIRLFLKKAEFLDLYNELKIQES